MDTRFITVKAAEPSQASQHKETSPKSQQQPQTHYFNMLRPYQGKTSLNCNICDSYFSDYMRKSATTTVKLLPVITFSNFDQNQWNFANFLKNIILTTDFNFSSIGWVEPCHPTLSYWKYSVNLQGVTCHCTAVTLPWNSHLIMHPYDYMSLRTHSTFGPSSNHPRKPASLNYIWVMLGHPTLSSS